jgi:hypothetical protein
MVWARARVNFLRIFGYDLNSDTLGSIFTGLRDATRRGLEKWGAEV